MAGVSVTAISRLLSRATTIVSASARKNTPGTPVRYASGRNTTTGVSVLPTSGRPTSRMASRAAVIRSRPAQSLAYIASTTTIASSITRPIDAAMPPSVIRLKLMPRAYIPASVLSTVTGIASAATTVVLAVRRKT